MKRPLVIGAGMIVLGLGATLVYAQLSSPGPLAMSHAQLDAPAHCNDCHVNNTPATHNEQCLDCHEHHDLRARIQAGRGLHASQMVAGQQCAGCHRDHRGPGFDLMGWQVIKGGEKNFDHALAGWPLDTDHATLVCAACHTTRNQQGLRTYLGVEPACTGCHDPVPARRVALRPEPPPPDPETPPSVPRRAPHGAFGAGGTLVLTGQRGDRQRADVAFDFKPQGRFGVLAAWRAFDQDRRGLVMAGLVYEGAASRPRLVLDLHAELGADLDARAPLLGGGIRATLKIVGPLGVTVDTGAYLVLDGDDTRLQLQSATLVGARW